MRAAVLKVTGSSSPIVTSRCLRTIRTAASGISKAQRLLGWEPKIDLEAGLKLSMAYFKQRSSWNKASKRENGRRLWSEKRTGMNGV